MEMWTTAMRGWTRLCGGYRALHAGEDGVVHSGAV